MAQSLANALLSSSLICLFALGFLPVFLTRRIIHFAHGAIIAVSAYGLLSVVSAIGSRGFAFGIALGIFIAFLLGLAIEKTIYCPLAYHGATPLILFISSLGMYAVITNTISLIFGDESRSIRFWPAQLGWDIFGARMTTAQILIVVCAILASGIMWACMQATRMGRQMKAVANDPALARVVGVNVEKVCLWAMGLGSVVGGIGGILLACDVDMTPTMGMQPLMMGLVAVIIGANTIGGTVLGALILGFAQHLGVLWLPSQWQDAIVFVILILFLLFRPQGFLGKPLRKAAV